MIFDEKGFLYLQKSGKDDILKKTFGFAERMEGESMRLAIVPGSFDPITVGHVNIIERAARLFDLVVVAVMINDQKKYRFTIEQRAQLAKLSCSHIPNVKVLISEGLLVDVVDSLGAAAIVKGVRTVKDFRYEQEMALFIKLRNPRAETVYLPCDPKYKRISSTLARERIDERKPLDGILMPEAIEKLKRGFDEPFGK